MVTIANGALRAVLACALALTPFAGVAGEGAQGGAAPQAEGFGIADYFGVQRVSELALSDDGRWLAYITESLSLERNARVREVRLRRLDGTGTEATAPAALADAYSLAWVPGGHALAFLSDRAGATQVFSFDVETGQVRQRTTSKAPVESYLFAPDGGALAYRSRETAGPGVSLYRRFRDEEAGIVVDPATTSSHDFVNPHWHGLAKRLPPTLWIDTAAAPAYRVPVPGEPSGEDGTYHWSSDGRWLSLAYVDERQPASQLRDERTSLGVYDLRSRRFRVVAEASARDGDRAGWNFSGGEWIPSEGKLLVRRVQETDPWVSWSHPQWAIVDPFAALPADPAAWHAVEIYPRGLKFTPVDAGRILVENTVEGVHSLFTLSPQGLRRADIVSGVDGSSSQIAFGADFRVAAFVNESLTRPPEIRLWRAGEPVRQVGQLNDAVARKIRYRAREVAWKGAGGLAIRGWLLEPPASAGTPPWPLVTHVHGGPAFPLPDAFVPYFDYWPYPLEALAERGIAVFLPNYRGTHTYGRAVAVAQGDEAIEDVVAGVDALVAAGTADPARLALTGHSHGALLGPQVMSRAKRFRAASFAEGSANSVVMYELMSEQANREIHDPILGASLYEAPQKYIADSPDLHFAGVSTATLFEAGAYTAAIHMLGFPKAARRAGMPTEFVVYPKTQHNLATPRLQQESATRNLDWLERWLLGRGERGAAGAAAQEQLQPRGGD
jgi:dipeptidyl aminopeptidase/acylaminoacyl peptidase